jgi:hypothetical protein
MLVAFDEVRKIAFRALDGAGAAPGTDEDGGWACAWLEAAGYPALEMLADLLDEGDLRSGLDISGGEIDAGGRSAIIHGALIAEYAAAIDGRVTVRNVRHAPFIAAHLSRLSRQGVHLRTDSEVVGTGDVVIGPGDGYAQQQSKVAAAIQTGIEVDRSSFDRVYAYSRAILVPQTEASLLTGAGAGLTDND